MQLIAPLFLRHEDLIGQHPLGQISPTSPIAPSALSTAASWQGATANLGDLLRTAPGLAGNPRLPLGPGSFPLHPNITAVPRNGGSPPRSQGKAEATSRSKDHFLAVLSHELRTPPHSRAHGLQAPGTRGLPARGYQTGYGHDPRAMSNSRPNSSTICWISAASPPASCTFISSA